MTINYLKKNKKSKQDIQIASSSYQCDQPGSSKDMDNLQIPSSSTISSEIKEVSSSTTIERTYGQTKLTSYIERKTVCKNKEETDNALMLLFIYDLQPFRMVESEAFRELTFGLNPNYTLPDRKTISKIMIPHLYEQCMTKVKTLLEQGSTFCITTDCWTSRIYETSYIGVTVHFLTEDFKLISVLLECGVLDMLHTSEDLATELLRIAVEWNIQNKILLAVSDNAENITNAIVGFREWRHLECFAHTINLIVEDGLKCDTITELLNKVREIAEHFECSYESSEKLSAYQTNAGTAVIELVEDTPTRWNSTYDMLRKFLEIEDALKSTLALIDEQLPILTHSDWKVIKDLCRVLKPFEDATKYISGELYCSGSVVIPISVGLRSVFQNLTKKDNLEHPVKEVTQLMFNSISERLANVEDSEILLSSTFLDPRFKVFAFSNDSVAEYAKTLITSAITKLHESNEESRLINLQSSPEKGHEELSLWSSFDCDVSSVRPTPTSRAIIEIERYLGDKILPRSDDPLNWWRNHKHIYPYLSVIAREKLCAVGSSVPCERLFSEAGEIMNDRRSMLSTRKTQLLIFLNANYKYL
ncbi:E3 SUMO-protein ligase ZBED1-like isoform X2 [Diabrotica virgifera virgifera]|uniref:HAT C-terminal dimerisation domain-containing protein n=1 Tax=Diabrotica virgifera virgifera TaxID=50390 RepID=A0ABM5KIU1_DIAVI|nr:E3 SUMO-protein ligase ZBED1-like isoform X2 [Diabrotica virgifera virgifera]